MSWLQLNALIQVCSEEKKPASKAQRYRNLQFGEKRNAFKDADKVSVKAATFAKGVISLIEEKPGLPAEAFPQG